MPLTVACDGSALGNPGPAGWAWYVDKNSWAAGGWPLATNNRGELQAVIEILKATRNSATDLLILADSKYVINSVTKWMPVWKRNNWKKKGGGEVLNRDQMEELSELVDELETTGRTLKFEWVKGHNNHTLNEAADAKARAAATAYQNGTEVPAGPGLNPPSNTAAPAVNTVPEHDVVTNAAQKVDRGQQSGPATVRVWCELDQKLADDIVAQARIQGMSPHEYLASLIRTGWEQA